MSDQQRTINGALKNRLEQWAQRLFGGVYMRLDGKDRGRSFITLSGAEPEKTLGTRITEHLKGQDGHRWQGTAYDLAKALNTSVNLPRILAVKLKRCKDEMERVGVHVTYRQIKGAHIIVLSLARKATIALTKTDKTEQSLRRSKILAESEFIGFPVLESMQR